MAHRPSSIDRLPEAVREQIGKLRQAGCTIDEILAKLHELDAGVSRSALGRHVKTLDQVAERMRESEVVANALAARFGEEGDEKVSRLNFQLMNSLVFQTLLAASGGEDGEGEEITLGAKDVKHLAGSLKDLATASKTNADRLLKVRAEIAREAAAAADKVGRAAGLSADTVEAIKHAVLGVAS